MLRALADFFGIHVHHWTDWEIVNRGMREDNGAPAVYQERECIHCGKIQNRIETP